MTRLAKLLIGTAAALTVVAATGCCLPLHGGHHGGRWDRQDGRGQPDRWSDGSRAAPPRAPERWR